MKTMIDLEKDNLFDFFTNMDLLKNREFIEQYSKTKEESELLATIFEKCIQIKQEEIINKGKKSNG